MKIHQRTFHDQRTKDKRGRVSPLRELNISKNTAATRELFATFIKNQLLSTNDAYGNIEVEL